MAIDRIFIEDNFPIDGNAYAILTDGERFAFTWGAYHPYDYENAP